eukprot:TRINITY_DN2137_c0_g1_i10.p1 TRINITY_DN2137_c0_g1~~TRINITY_DN2137_c0_g1_i10.p1  ORF type:complete len:130 (-),score=31.04 TRINITY_DN2137_c0_g1_i10:334-723(-)
MTEHEHRARLFFSTIATGIITTFFLNWYPVPDPTRYKLKDNQGSNSEESNSEEELEENHNSHHRTEMLRKELKHFALSISNIRGPTLNPNICTKHLSTLVGMPKNHMYSPQLIFLNFSFCYHQFLDLFC